jgi:chromosome partitioning protein
MLEVPGGSLRAAVGKLRQQNKNDNMLLNLPASPDLRKIVILNPKGGAGKTTLATNLAGYLASTERHVALMDFDPQQSSMRWLTSRPDNRPTIHGIAAHKRNYSVTRSFQFQIPPHIEYLVADTPAALCDDQLIEFTAGAHAILVPVLPSAIDIRAASGLIASLLLRAKVSRRMGRLGVVVNRARENTIAYRKLMFFLNRLSISVVTVLRDSQSYVRGAELGMSLHEMRPSDVDKDLPRWWPLTDWLEERVETELTPRDLWRPKQAKDNRPSFPEDIEPQRIVIV